MSLFVDTSAWYAAADISDRSNVRARGILCERERLITTDHVLIGTWLLLHHRLNRSAAERFWYGLRAGVAKVELVTAEDLDAEWAIGELFSDQDFSVVDCTSFAVMQRLGIRRVASFDDDFAVFRYGPNRDRALDLLRLLGECGPKPHSRNGAGTRGWTSTSRVR